MQGINMHADFAKVNINFWVTPDSACANNTKGGMVIYDVPAPASWTFMDYNTNQSKMMAYLKVHNAQSTRVPYRANRCVLFDSSLIHITDELHFNMPHVRNLNFCIERRLPEICIGLPGSLLNNAAHLR